MENLREGKINFVIYIAFMIWSIFQMSCALDNGLALTPPMGWLSWERFRCTINCKEFPDICLSEKLFKEMADHLVDDGYASFGYDTIILDDCWMDKKRDKESKLVGDPERFPSGMKSLGDYFHGKGLKFGIYADFGLKTCAGYPGSQGFLKIDAETFAAWGVEYVKLDGCFSEEWEKDEGYPEFGKELNETGRPIVYSCSWPAYEKEPNYTAVSEVCNLWRNYDDIDDSWNSVKSIMNYYAEIQERLIPVAGPGKWNDPDMLLIGNFGLSFVQSKSQMAIWAILAAPLIMSNDLRNIKPDMKDILMNKEVIDINQDKYGIQGKRIAVVSEIQIWNRHVSPVINGNWSYATAFYNDKTGGPGQRIIVSLKSIGIHTSPTYLIRDLFEHKDCGLFSSKDKLQIDIVPTGVVFLKLTPVDKWYDIQSNSILYSVNSCHEVKIKLGMSEFQSNAFYTQNIGETGRLVKQEKN